MAGTKAGGAKASETNKRLYGADFYQRIGQEGGVRRVPKGFALMDKAKVREAGRKGGTISKRNKEQ